MAKMPDGVDDSRGEGEPQQLTVAGARHNLWRGLIELGILVGLVVGLLLAIPGLRGVAHAVSHMHAGWVAAGVAFEILSCLGYVLAFLQVFEPLRGGSEPASRSASSRSGRRCRSAGPAAPRSVRCCSSTGAGRRRAWPSGPRCCSC